MNLNKINLTKLHDKLYNDLFHKDIFPQEIVVDTHIISDSQMTDFFELELEIKEICNQIHTV